MITQRLHPHALYGMLVTLCAFATAPAARGQLTDLDFAALEAQAAAESWTFTTGPNPATAYPLEQLCGLVEPPDWEATARFVDLQPQRELPAQFDWRALGGCTPIRNQGGCGSCWAFGSVGALECAILIHDGVSVNLSEQWLVSCNTNGWGCDGGWFAHDYFQWKPDPCGGTGAVLESAFPYTATDAPCNCPYPHSYTIDDWAFVGSSGGVPSVAAIKQAIMTYGPVSVAVYANSAMQGYTGGVFNGCASGQVNHAVVLVGWDDTQGTSGVWIMRNSWSSGWGESGYMRIPYNCSSIGYGACYVDYAGANLTLSFSYPDGRPSLVEPGQPTTIRVNVAAGTGTPVPNTGQVHYSLNGGAYTTAAMQQLSTNNYQATLPAAACGDQYRWYVSAQEASTGRRYDPADAPATTWSATAALGQTVVLADEFETDGGWTVTAGATTGNWERAVPQYTVVSGEYDPVQPGADHSTTGTRCFVTGAAAGSGAGSYDVDGGPTRLTSPLLNLAGLDATVSYWRWYHISTAWDDALVVEVSANNGSTWVPVETVANRETWTYVEWRVSDFVTPSAQVRVRFTANDGGSGSLIEALVDDFQVTALTCSSAPQICRGDADCDGAIGFADIDYFVAAIPDNQAAWQAKFPGGVPPAGCTFDNCDANGNGTVGFDDIDAFTARIPSACP